ncbi:ABC transporter permease [Clostridium felsineum]|uniref:ABC transporter permease n=1 Tax=Clostridium felsineum TaxID=36839 RepID=UPI00098C8621|nr:ABC transporter permease [Clostridium felsineum]URZ02601.1 hypothetical protein CLAUR_026130 [Clostridium felsineum]
MVINRRISRDLKNNFFRYLAVLIIVILSMAIVVGYGNTTQTVKDTEKDYWKNTHVEDGEFTVYTPLSKKQSKDLESKGVRLEKSWYIDLKSSKNTTIRVFEDRSNINLVQIDKGNKSFKNNNIVIDHKFANDMKFNIGDKVKLNNNTYNISGTCSVPDYAHRVANISDVGTDKNFGLAFVSKNQFNNICTSNKDIIQYNYTYVLKGNTTSKAVKDYLQKIELDKSYIKDTYVLDKINKNSNKKNEFLANFDKIISESRNLSDGINQMSNTMKSSLSKLPIENNNMNMMFDNMNTLSNGSIDITNAMSKLKEMNKYYLNNTSKYAFPNLSYFQATNTNSRIVDFLQAHTSYINVAIIIGIMLSILIAYILSVFAIHSVDKDSTVIGSLYSLGYLKSELLKHYMILPVAIVIIGAVIGSLIGFQLAPLFVDQNYLYPTLKITYPWYLCAFGIGMPSIIVIFVNFFVINNKLKQTPLSMLKKEKGSVKVSKINMQNMKFINIFRIRQFLRELRSNVVLLFGIFISIIIMMLGMSIYGTMVHYAENINNDMNYNYMYVLRNPLQNNIRYSEKAYVKDFTIYSSLAKTDMPVTLQGIINNSKYFKFSNRLQNDQNLIYVSDSAAAKFGYKVGDIVTLNDSLNDKYYSFKVAGIVPFRNGIYFFMNINAMRKYFNEDKEYYNTLFSLKKLNIDSAMKINTITKKSVLDTSKSWVDKEVGVYGMFLAIAIVIFILVMYILVKTMIERSQSSISLVKMFGFNDNEVKKMYLGNTIYVVLVAIVITFPIGTILMNKLMLFVLATVKSGIDCYISPISYVIMTLIVIGSYLVSYYILNCKLKKISFIEILKGRE